MIPQEQSNRKDLFKMPAPIKRRRHHWWRALVSQVVMVWWMVWFGVVMSDGWCSMMIKGRSFIKSPPLKDMLIKVVSMKRPILAYQPFIIWYSINTTVEKQQHLCYNWYVYIAEASHKGMIGWNWKRLIKIERTTFLSKYQLRFILCDIGRCF